jgi:hypothetical protein
MCTIYIIFYFRYVHFKNGNDGEESLREIEKERGLSRMSDKKILLQNKFRYYRCRKMQHSDSRFQTRRKFADGF